MFEFFIYQNQTYIYMKQKIKSFMILNTIKYNLNKKLILLYCDFVGIYLRIN